MDTYLFTETEYYTIMEEPVGSGNGGRKEQVYISGHPADRAVFGEIAAELFPEYHCRALLSKNREYSLQKEELQMILGEMSMVVILVSSRFLHEENAARGLLMSAAQEAGIRIMTVQIEKGIEAEFSRICGAYHLLNRTAADYLPQLKAYINQHVNVYRLIGLSSEQTEILKSLFSLRAFVSYRKKDRVYMRKLLKLIRSCPLFLDISVWYDDALVPGEDFNDQIRDEIDRADFVLLVVTPHLMEEGNYVHRYEYTHALRTGKPLLPVIMEDTDIQGMKYFYPGVSGYIRGDDPAALTEALLQMRKKPVLPEYEITPLRKYLLARAYAAGEGTERDPDLSFRLYLESAQEGEARSMARIGEDLYQGNGMDRDREAGIYWISRAAAKLHDQMLQTSPEQPEASSLGHDVFRLADILALDSMSRKNYDQAWQYLLLERDAAEYLWKNGFISARFNPGIVFLHMGELSFLRQAYPEAEASYAKAEHWLSTMEGALGNVYAGMYMAELAANSGRLYAVLFRNGQPEKLEPAIRCLSDALDRSVELCRLSDQNSHIPLQAAQDLLDLGKAFEQMQGGMPFAMDIYRKACEKLKPLQKTGFPVLKQIYAIALCQAAIAGQAIPDREMLEESLEILNDLCRRFPGDSNLLQNLVTVKYALAIWPHSPDEQSAGGAAADRREESPKDILDRNTRWNWLEPEEKSSFSPFLPADGLVQAGAWGESNGNFRLSSYVCPHCGTALYKVVFPVGKDPELVYDHQTGECLRPARVFASPCGRLFAAPRGRQIKDGPVLQAIIVHGSGNPQEQQLFNLWCEYLSSIGDLSARRSE